MMKRKKLWIGIGVIAILAIIAGFAFSGNGAPQYETIVAERGEFVQEVSVTGRVKAETEVKLAFPLEGTIAAIYVKEGTEVARGQALASLDATSFLIEKKEAEADVALRSAELEKLLTPPVTISGAKNLSIETEYVDLLNAAHDGFEASTSAKNLIISLLANTKLTSVLTEVYALQDARNDIRTDIAEEAQSEANRVMSAETIEEYANATTETIRATKGALLLFDTIINRALPGNQVTQADLDGYAADIRARKPSVQSAEAALNSAMNDVRNAELGTDTDIEIARARLRAAESKVESVDKKVSDATLRAPGAGVVTNIEPEVGERVKSGEVAITFLSDELVIEADIPEADIAAIEIEDPAKVTLDAYGDDLVFEANVLRIDPAETVIEGVPTYTTSFFFTAPDARIWPGMTANIDILTDRREGILAIPARAIISSGGKKIVRVLISEGVIEEQEVSTGLRASDGTVEVREGIEEGMVVITAMDQE